MRWHKLGKHKTLLHPKTQFFYFLLLYTFTPLHLVWLVISYFADCIVAKFKTNLFCWQLDKIKKKTILIIKKTLNIGSDMFTKVISRHIMLLLLEYDFGVFFWHTDCLLTGWSEVFCSRLTWWEPICLRHPTTVWAGWCTCTTAPSCSRGPSSRSAPPQTCRAWCYRWRAE